MAEEAEVRRRLTSLRAALLHLHKVLLDDERENYERRHGAVSAGELLQLVIGDEWFAWLHPVSELIVSIDEALDAEEPATAESAEPLLKQVRLLLKPSESGDEFGRRYFAALQREPAVVLAHARVTAILQADRAKQ